MSLLQIYKNEDPVGFYNTHLQPDKAFSNQYPPEFNILDNFGSKG